MNDEGNKLLTPPNQNLQTFPNSLPSHFTNFFEFEPLSFSPNDLGIEYNNFVNLNDKPKLTKDLFIIFDPSETIVALDGPL